MDLTALVSAIPALAPYAGYVAAIVGIAAVVAPYLPPPVAGAAGWYPKAYAAVNWIACNFGHARNATAPVTRPIQTPNTSASVS